MNAHWEANNATKILKWYLGIASLTRPAAFYLGLSAVSADPNNGPFTDITVANYARKPVTWSFVSNVYAINASQLDFVNLGAGTVIGQGIFDASTGGNLLFWADLDVTVSFGTGHTLSYPQGIIRVGMTV